VMSAAVRAAMEDGQPRRRRFSGVRAVATGAALVTAARFAAHHVPRISDAMAELPELARGQLARHGWIDDHGEDEYEDEDAYEGEDEEESGEEPEPEDEDEEPEPEPDGDEYEEPALEDTEEEAEPEPDEEREAVVDPTSRPPEPPERDEEDEREETTANG
jgi:hypothetical protein